MEQRRALDKARAPKQAKDYDARWRALRHAYLSRNPLCVLCKAVDVIEPARVVDHIHPIATHPELRLDWGNLRALCKRCHDQHTARTRGWGRGSSNPTTGGG